MSIIEQNFQSLETRLKNNKKPYTRKISKPASKLSKQIAVIEQDGFIPSKKINLSKMKDFLKKTSVYIKGHKGISVAIAGGVTALGTLVGILISKAHQEKIEKDPSEKLYAHQG